MKQYLFSRRPLILGVLTAALAAAAPAQAATISVDTSWCSNPLISQPFVSAGDSNWYVLTPGESPGSFDGSGWTLSGGARILTVNLPDGTTRSVLDLPSGSEAVSPTICVTSAYPTARTMVRDVAGSEGVSFNVGYAGTGTWTKPKNTGQFHGSGTAWTLATPVNVQPNSVSGWQPVRFTLIPGGKTSDFQIYDFYIDPRMT